VRNSNLIEHKLNRWYVRWIRPRISAEIDRQRLKLIYDVWGYAPFLSIKTLTLRQKLTILRKFLSVDWNVLHGHKPKEISAVCKALAARLARPGEVVVEAGCWNGGSSAKFSVMCAALGYRFYIYDSFEGVEQMTPDEISESFNFSGSYSAGEEVVRKTLVDYGSPEVCSLHKGWFAETLGTGPLSYSVRLAYIDCDVAAGTQNALIGIVPSLVSDGQIFSQDFHLPPVRRLLENPATWTGFGKGQPVISGSGQLATISFDADDVGHRS